MPLRLADGMAKILRPLGRCQLPIMMVIALRFIPMLAAEGEKLISVQKARGAQLEGRNVFKRLEALMPVLTPLLRNSFRMADELAVGMESRGYNGGARSHLYELKFTRDDVIALAAAVAMIPLTLAINGFMAWLS